MAEKSAEMNQQKETKIPVFSVLKNNSFFKNIILTGPPSPGSSIPSIESKNSGIDKSEWIFVVGRHPDCNIQLAHPSISRSHLHIRYVPSLQSLSVSDLSSVHGTWVCGKRIEPYIRVELQEGDTLQLGASSRMYRLHWVPRSGIDDFSNPYLPTINESESLEEKEDEDLLHKDQGSLFGGEQDLCLKLNGLTLTSSGYATEDEREESHEGENCMCPDDQSETRNGGWGEDIMSLFADMNMTTLRSKPMTVSSFTLDGMESPSMSKEDKIFESSLNCHESTQHQGTEMVERDDKDQGSLCGGEQDLSQKLDGLTLTSSDYTSEDEKEESHKGENCMCPDDQSETKSDGWEEDIMLLHADMNMTTLTVTSFMLDGEDKIFESSLNCHESSQHQGTEMMERDDTKGEYRNLADDDGVEGLSLLFTDMNSVTESNQWTPSDNLMPADEQSHLMPADEQSPFSCHVVAEKTATFFKPVIPSAPLDPEGTISNYIGEEEGNHNPFDNGINCSPRSTKSLNKYWNPSSALAWQGDAKSQFCYKDDEDDSNPLSTGVTDKQATLEHAKQNMSPNDSCISGKPQPESPFTPKLRTTVKSELRLESLSYSSLTYCSDGENEEAFTPDKENISPATRLLMSMKKVGVKELKPKTSRSPLKNVDSNVYKVVGKSSSSGKVIELRKLLYGKKNARSACKSDKEREPDVYVSKGRPDKAPLQVLSMNIDNRNSEECKSDKEREPDVYVSKGWPDETLLQVLTVNSDGRNPEASNLDVTDTGSCNSMNDPHVSKPICLLNALEEKSKKWTMVVDSACLLDKDSRKALQLMQGLPRTNMIIRRIVIMELDYLTKRCSLFRSTKQASAALQWIEDCMVNNQAGIHVESAMEDKSHITPTLFASVLSLLSDYKTKFSAPFSRSAGGLFEIASPSAEDQILDCAVNLRRTKDNGQVVLLSDNISLKIKAMAEGLLCQSAKQFRESLVNPFSERFLWPHTSPRGRTWACNDVAVKNEYYNGQAQGLKLVLH